MPPFTYLSVLEILLWIGLKSKVFFFLSRLYNAAKRKSIGRDAHNWYANMQSSLKVILATINCYNSANALINVHLLCYDKKLLYILT